jgi:membrane protein implicated in regulation of membrane protease activity
VIHVSRSAYLHQVVRGAYLWLISGGFALYILLGALAIWLNRSSMYTHMVAAVLAARGLSYVFYPNGDQRYTAVLFVLVLVALVVAIRVSLQTRFAQDRRQNASAAPTAWSAVSGSTAR